MVEKQIIKIPIPVRFIKELGWDVRTKLHIRTESGQLVISEMKQMA